MAAIIAEDRNVRKGVVTRARNMERTALYQGPLLLCRPAPCFSGTPFSPSRGSLRAARACCGAFGDKSPPNFPQDATFPTTAATSHAPSSPRASPSPTPNPTQRCQVFQEEDRATWVSDLATGKNPSLGEARGLDLPLLLESEGQPWPTLSSPYPLEFVPSLFK